VDHSGLVLHALDKLGLLHLNTLDQFDSCLMLIGL